MTLIMSSRYNNIIIIYKNVTCKVLAIHHYKNVVALACMLKYK